jgi:hypothetical protein
LFMYRPAFTQILEALAKQWRMIRYSVRNLWSV